MLSSFTIQNYRAFARKQTIECRPLTLFFGRNSSGKSALLRFLPLLAESYPSRGGPILLSGEIGRKAGWRDLVCKATENNKLRLKLNWLAEPITAADWAVDGDFEDQWRIVENLTVSHNELNQLVLYEFRDADEWQGLLPTKFPPVLNNASALGDLHTQLTDLCAQVQWVSGIRGQPERFVTYEQGALGSLEHDGSNAAMHLIAARIKGESALLLEMAQRFFIAQGETLLFRNLTSQLWRVMLAPSATPHLAVDLCDTGEGYAQVLPVLVALARACTGGPRLLCLEQPELHLHTRAQAELAKVLVETANDPAQPQLLVETHSEVLLTSVQLAIAEGRIKPEMVRVYWVSARGDGTSDAQAVDFDTLGRPQNSLLMNAFDDTTRLGQSLMTRQMAEFRAKNPMFAESADSAELVPD